MAVSELLLFCFLSCREIGLRVGLVLSRDEREMRSRSRYVQFDSPTRP